MKSFDFTYYVKDKFIFCQEHLFNWFLMYKYYNEINGGKMKDKSPYYIGIDLGTNSVGWAVTDEDYNILKFKKKIYGVLDFLKREKLHKQEEKRDLLEED